MSKNDLKIDNLKNHFLIATPALKDAPFKHSVIFICEHNDEGAMGIVINKPVELTIEEMLAQIELKPNESMSEFKLDRPVLVGGPVMPDRGFILHNSTGKYDNTLKVNPNISLTTSKDILETLGTSAQPQNFLVALGFSSWTTGQLENEIKENSWLISCANEEIIFHTPIPMRWTKSLELLGIKPMQLTAQMGHA